jgi:hypothetical protein
MANQRKFYTQVTCIVCGEPLRKMELSLCDKCIENRKAELFKAFGE